MAGTFAERTRELEDRVGIGTLGAKVEFNQAYAHRQHEELAWDHPYGGGPKYLERALFEHYAEYYEILAKGFMPAVETNLKLSDVMLIVGERFKSRAQDNAPRRQVKTLRDSAHLTITDHDAPVYDQPGTARLSPQQISFLNERLQQPDHWYGAWPPAPGLIGESRHLKEELGWAKAEIRRLETQLATTQSSRRRARIAAEIAKLKAYGQ